MTHFVIPRMFDEALNLEDGEDAYIVRESTKPMSVVFARGSVKNRTVVYVGSVQNWNEKKNSEALFQYDYAIVKAPRNIVPNQRKCKCSMCIEDEDGDFLIILR